MKDTRCTNPNAHTANHYLILLWDTLVGHSCTRHSCGTLLWTLLRDTLVKTLVGHSRATLLRDTVVVADALVENSWGALSCDTCVGHSLLWGTLVGRSCGTLLWETLVGLRTLSWDTLVEYSCPALLWNTLLRDALAGHCCRILLWQTLM